MSGLTAPNMMVNGKITKLMAMEFTRGMTVESTTVSGLRMTCRVSGYTFIAME